MIVLKVMNVMVFVILVSLAGGQGNVVQLQHGDLAQKSPGTCKLLAIV